MFLQSRLESGLDGRSDETERTRFGEEQVIGVVKEAKARAKTADLAWRHGVSEAARRVGNDDLRLEVEVWRVEGVRGSRVEHA